MNKMKDVLDRLAAASVDANTALETIALGKRPGWSMRIAAAQQNMVELANEYKGHLAKAITQKVFLRGRPEDVVAFLPLLSELDIDGLAADAGTLYRRLADAVASSMGLRGEFSLHQFSLLNSAVGDVAVENPELDVKDAACEFVPSIRSYDALYAHVRASFRQTNGDKTNVALMNKRIVKQALAIDLTEPTLLFIRNAKDDELADISLSVIGGPAVVLNVPPSPTLESAKAALAVLGSPQAPLEREKSPEKKKRAPKKQQAEQQNNPTQNTEE